ncbi:MAG: right-handed parallel beta-helix repeat-containing protein [Candidatus Thermoplasmatota archaeon]|nr:right-handed parallel beta-helix repeat-containing protein [Candidatus Thermoplasmatota archaeon]
MIKRKKICIIISLTIGIIFIINLGGDQIEAISFKRFNQNIVREVLYVGGSGPGNFSKIQDAIDNASSGDNIFVFHGIYLENISVYKRLSIIGECKENTIIDAKNKGYSINISVDGVSVSGFTIQNGSYSGNLINKANLFINSSDNIIKENIFKYSESGIMIVNSNRNNISNNIISDNVIGLWLIGSKNNVYKNLIINNSNIGIDLLGSENIISNNMIFNNNDIGLYLIDSSKNNILNNEISNNSIGIVLTWNRENDENRNNVISKNNFRNNTKSDSGFVEHLGINQKNIWKNNYWEKSRLFPKLILGLKQTRFYFPTPFGALWFFIPWFHFDLNPAKQPYLIII